MPDQTGTDDSPVPFQLAATLNNGGAVVSVFIVAIASPANTATAPSRTASGTSRGGAADFPSPGGGHTSSGASSGSGDTSTQGCDSSSLSGNPGAAVPDQAQVRLAAASATAAAIRVCTPQGLVVEMSTSGHVLLAPACQGDVKVGCCSRNLNAVGTGMQGSFNERRLVCDGGSNLLVQQCHRHDLPNPGTLLQVKRFTGSLGSWLPQRAAWLQLLP